MPLRKQNASERDRIGKPNRRTQFLIAMNEATPERLNKMDTAKVAAHYGLPEQDVIDERNWRLGRW